MDEAVTMTFHNREETVLSVDSSQAACKAENDEFRASGFPVLKAFRRRSTAALGRAANLYTIAQAPHLPQERTLQTISDLDSVGSASSCVVSCRQSRALLDRLTSTTRPSAAAANILDPCDWWERRSWRLS